MLFPIGDDDSRLQGFAIVSISLLLANLFAQLGAS